MIDVEQIWLAREPLDMRAGPETALARVVNTFGAATPRHAYVFSNKRCNRIKILVCDNFGFWLAARRLHKGSFVWTQIRKGDAVSITDEQLSALILGLPWQYARADFSIGRH